MKVQFEDNSFIEIKKSDNPGKILIIISAKDHINQFKKITNVAEVTEEEFKTLLSGII